MIFFSAHGVPLTYVTDAGDPYKDQMEDCIALIMEELRSRGTLNNHTLAYQVQVYRKNRQMTTYLVNYCLEL
jgi:ferrochelatase